MLELMVVAAAASGLFAIAKGIRANQRFRIDPSMLVRLRDERGDDLPCPWCYAPTQEHDTRCSGCGSLFG